MKDLVDLLRGWAVRVVDSIVEIFRFAFFSHELTLAARVITGISVAFLTYFIVDEFDGIRVLYNFIADAINSIPSFIQGVYEYFGAVATEPLIDSLLVGGIFGALTTGLILLNTAGMLRWPKLSQRSVVIGFAAGAIAYYLDSGFWNALLIGIGVLFVVNYVYEEELREFLSWKTVETIFKREALPVLARGAAVGTLVGAIGAQILMYPAQHCTYGPDVPRIEYRLGLLITVVSALFLLLPLWSYFRRGRNRSRGSESGYFKGITLPYVFLAPTLFILAVFLYYPGIQVVTLSLKLSRLGIERERFMCMANYSGLIESGSYSHSLSRTLTLTIAIVLFSMAISLAIALLASQKIRGIQAYRTLLIWPYAVSPVVAGVIFLVMFNPVVGVVNWSLTETTQFFGIDDNLVQWFPALANEQGNLGPQWFQQPNLAPWVVISAAVWNSLGFNILFYMAGLQNVPTDLLEAAAIDGANRGQRFFRVTFPLLSPYTFFLLITNVTYSFFSIFGAVDNLTQGGPWRQGESGEAVGATNVLIYKIYQDAFEFRKLSDAATQSMILFLLVAGITIFQFRFIEGRVTYGGQG